MAQPKYLVNAQFSIRCHLVQSSVLYNFEVRKGILVYSLNADIQNMLKPNNMLYH